MGAGVLETVARIVHLGGAEDKAARVAEMRARFEARTGAYVPEDAWFEDEHPGQGRRNFLEQIHRKANHLNCMHQNTFSRNSCSRYAP